MLHTSWVTWAGSTSVCSLFHVMVWETFLTVDTPTIITAVCTVSSVTGFPVQFLVKVTFITHTITVTSWYNINQPVYILLLSGKQLTINVLFSQTCKKISLNIRNLFLSVINEWMNLPIKHKKFTTIHRWSKEQGPILKLVFKPMTYGTTIKFKQSTA